MDMKDRRLVWVLLLTMSVLVAGCAKKSNEQTTIAATGFDSGTATPATTNEELSQLPQASTPNQQGAVEALPVEASPVTPAVSTLVAPGADAISASSKSLSRDQEIQTALKNLGLYNGKIDGKLGPGSKKAIEAFQKQSGLKADGKVGPKTWAALSSHLSGFSASSADASTTAATSAENQ